jgi:hypothetical protein
MAKVDLCYLVLWYKALRFTNMSQARQRPGSSLQSSRATGGFVATHEIPISTFLAAMTRPSMPLKHKTLLFQFASTCGLPKKLKQFFQITNTRPQMLADIAWHASAKSVTGM